MPTGRRMEGENLIQSLLRTLTETLKNQGDIAKDLEGAYNAIEDLATEVDKLPSKVAHILEDKLRFFFQDQELIRERGKAVFNESLERCIDEKLKAHAVQLKINGKKERDEASEKWKNWVIILLVVIIAVLCGVKLSELPIFPQ